jgi:diguanylate cyclase (GGDEF)-like protein
VLEQELENSCDEPAGPESPALVLCDIDGLKAVNDAHGHEAGDRVIVRVAAVLTEAAGDHHDAVVSRIGGDEFCVLLPSGDAESARAVAEATARCLSSADGLPVTVSCGVAARSEGLDRPAALLHAADFAQYRAKRAGPRVAVEAAGPADPPEPLDAEGGRSFRGHHEPARRELAEELLALVENGDGTTPEELLEALRRRLAAEATLMP